MRQDFTIPTIQLCKFDKETIVTISNNTKAINDLHSKGISRDNIDNVSFDSLSFR